MPHTPTEKYSFFLFPFINKHFAFLQYKLSRDMDEWIQNTEGEMTFQVRMNEVSDSILRPFLRQYCDLSADHILCSNSGDCGHQGNSSTLFQLKLLVCFLVGRVGGFLPPFSRMENNLSTRKWWWRQREGNQESKSRWKFQMPLLNWSTFLGWLP